MKMPVTQSELQNDVSVLSRVSCCHGTKLEWIAKGPTNVRFVNPSQTAKPIGTRKRSINSPNVGVKRPKLLHWYRSLSRRVFQSSDVEGPVTVSTNGIDAITGPFSRL